MAFILHLLTTAVCALEYLAAMRDVRSNVAKLAVFGGMGLVHGLVPAWTRLEDLPAAFSSLSPSSRVTAAAMGLLGILALSAGWRAYEWWRRPWTKLSPVLIAVLESADGQRLLRRLFWISAIAAIVAWVAMVLATGAGIIEYLIAPRFTFRLAGTTQLQAVASQFIGLAAIPGFVCFFLPKHYRVMGVVYALVIAIFFYYAYKGSRMPPFSVVGGVVMGFALRHRLSLRRFGVLSLSGLLVVLLSVSLYTIRWELMRTTPGKVLQMLASLDTYRGALARDPLSYHQYLVSAVELFPEHHSYVNGGTYRRILFFFLPRAYFPVLKPEDTAQVFARAVSPGKGIAEAMIPPTLMGDAYINFWGWPGLLVLSVDGVVFGFVACRMRVNVLWFLAFGASFLRFVLLAIRGQPYEMFVYSVSMLLLVWFLGRVCGFSYRWAKLTTQIQGTHGLDPLASQRSEYSREAGLCHRHGLR
ncbi:MAG: hypothetical protein V1790_06685 [Planctomycetota bacterium]